MHFSSNLSSEVHHDEEKGLQKGELVLQHPDQRQSLHQELDGHHTAELGVPGLFIAAGAQTLHDVREQGQLTRLQVKTRGQGDVSIHPI